MGWRLRSSAEAMQGNRDYMEDITSVEFERVSTSKGDFETASYAVYDGHGGPEASFFAKVSLRVSPGDEKWTALGSPDGTHQKRG